MVQGFAYHRLVQQTVLEQKPSQIYTSLAALQQAAYASPDLWLWHPEARGIARQRDTMQPSNTPAFAAWLKQVPPVKGTVNQVATLLNLYVNNRGKIVNRFFPQFAEGGVFCDENVAIFRNILMRRGIQSRVVVFQFDDGDGGDSHTALEVWLPGKQTWAYVDPHFGVLDQRSVLEILLSHTPPKTIDALNQPAINAVFNRGTHEVIYENFAPRQRIIYRASKA
jgi:hypothetical protein